MIVVRPPVRPVPAGGTAGTAGVSVPTILSTVGAALVVGLVVAAATVGPAPLLLWGTTVRVLLDLSAAAVLGILGLLLLPGGNPPRSRLLDAAAVAAGVWAVAAGTTGFLLYLGQAPPIASPAFGPGLVSFLADVVPGRTWLVATVLAAVLSAGLLAARSRRGVQLLTLLAVAALVPVAAQSTVSDQSLAGTRQAGTAAFVVLVAMGTWIGASALLGGMRGVDLDRRARRLPVVCGVVALAGIALGGMPPTPLTVVVAVLLLLAIAGAAALPMPRRPVVLLQLLLLGATAGLAATVRATGIAPGSTGSRTTPAEILTGAPLPPAPTLARLLLGWQPDALWLLVAAGLLLGYVDRVVRLRRTGAAWPAARTASWVLGVLLLVWLTSGGPAEYAPVLLSVSLAQHAALVAVVPLLLAAGLPRPPGATGRRGGPLGRPVVAAAVAAGAFVVLYGTGMLRWSVTDAVGTEEAALQCLLTGALLVHALGGAGRRTAVGVLVALLVVETVAAAGPALGPGLLLADWFGAMGWGTDALGDQRLGAVVAWAIAVVPTLVLLGAALRRSAGSPPPASAAGAATGREVSA